MDNERDDDIWTTIPPVTGVDTIEITVGDNEYLTSWPDTLDWGPPYPKKLKLTTENGNEVLVEAEKLEVMAKFVDFIESLDSEHPLMEEFNLFRTQKKLEGE